MTQRAVAERGMALQVLLAEIDPGWHGGLEPELLSRANGSRLGRRLLARWLAKAAAATLLAPAPGDGPIGVVLRWPRAGVAALTRDLGALAFAPAIRAEVRREPVRRLKQALGNSYLLALDNTVWNGRVDPATSQRLATGLAQALTSDASGDDNTALYALLDRQGRAELDEWARSHDPALGEWARLLQPGDAVSDPAHLPEKPLLRVYTHHQSRRAAH
ncbi:hypothetical protein IP90_03144 [Luteimonas cucumeris]|uniref:Uncharacterized protein n=2 Tax=Luteimonas cucumeris TaxID=985012 RepID=A0A562KVU3_9GAMM|nr:hypothetical protein IP90_03144 [Luteimonas cucumeris]